MCRGAKNGICRFISRTWSTDRMFLCIDFSTLHSHIRGNTVLSPVGASPPLFNVEVCDIHLYCPIHSSRWLMLNAVCLGGEKSQGLKCLLADLENSKNHSLPLPMMHVATFEDLSMSEKHFAYNRTSSVV